MGDTMTCPICGSTDTAKSDNPDDGDDWLCRNPECQAKFLPVQEV